MLGHTSTRMVDLVYGKLAPKTYQDAVALLPESCAVFETQDRSQGDNDGTYGTHVTADPKRKTPESFNDSGDYVVPRDRIELPTRGFSVPVVDEVKRRRLKKKKRTG